ncbi:hypothetical protein BGP_2168 [Beggiatoa sp. PS]|nr:hypothetical protein BGP_2168 [Beggiatoa sp. PS]
MWSVPYSFCPLFFLDEKMARHLLGCQSNPVVTFQASVGCIPRTNKSDNQRQVWVPCNVAFPHIINDFKPCR